LAVRFDIPIYSTQLVASVDYGLTQFENGKLRLSVACRVGNVTRVCDMTELFGPAGTDALELSFPALRGASGAPVFYQHTDTVIGVVNGNVDRDLLPIQVRKTFGDEGQLVEERKFLLPVSVAVNIKHLRPMWERVQGARA
jgi:hypothetical protein